MKEALGLEHVEVGDLRQSGMGGHGVLQTGGLVGLDLVGRGSEALLRQVCGGLQPGHPAGGLEVVLVDAFDVLEDHNDVAGPGVGRIVGPGTCHVDDAFLKADDLSCGHDGGSGEDEGLALAYGFDVRHHAGEDAAGAFHLEAGLHDVLHGKDADALAGKGKVHVHLREPFVSGKNGKKLLLVHRQHAALGKGCVTPGQLVDFYLVQLKFHGCLFPPFWV